MFRGPARSTIGAMYLERNIVVTLFNHPYNGSATMRSVRIVELHVTVSNIECYIQMLLWRIYVTGYN
jgi:hypothetical protein